MAVEINELGLRCGLAPRPMPQGAASIAALVDALPRTGEPALIDREGSARRNLACSSANRSRWTAAELLRADQDCCIERGAMRRCSAPQGRFGPKMAPGDIFTQIRFSCRVVNTH